MRLRFLSSVVLFAWFTMACEPAPLGRGSPPWRSTTATNPFPDVHPGHPAPDAVLVFTQVTVSLERPTKSGGFEYLTMFQLRETSGRSGATIQRVTTSVNGGQDEQMGPECWGDPIRVPAGGTLDTFAFGSTGLSCCAPWTASPVEATSFTLIVTFIDDSGRAGRLGATGMVTK